MYVECLIEIVLKLIVWHRLSDNWLSDNRLSDNRLSDNWFSEGWLPDNRLSDNWFFDNLFSDKFVYLSFNLVTGEVFLADGGYYVDGRLFCKVDESQILEIGEKIKASKIRNVVIAGKIDLNLYYAKLCFSLMTTYLVWKNRWKILIL